MAALSPRSPVLLQYGDRFPQFLRSIGNGPSAEYAADIAELEAARVRAYHAPDATPLRPDAFAKLPPGTLPDLGFELHPSVSLVRSRFPIVSAWEAGQRDDDLELWKAEAALIVRPHLDVQVWRLPPGGYEFFVAIAEGRTVGVAATEATAVAGEFNLAEIFHVLIFAGAITGLTRPG
jgi:hypothetical protein